MRAKGEGKGEAETRDVSVVIPSVDLDRLLECLDGLLDDAERVGEFILVIDEVPLEEVQAFVEKEIEWPAPWSLVYSPTRVGGTMAYHRGCSLATLEYILQLDDGCVPTRGMLTNLMRALERHPEFGWVSPRPIEQPWDPVKGNCFLTRRSVFEGVGGWRDSLVYGGAHFDDSDLIMRYWHDGWEPCGVHEAQVHNQENLTTNPRDNAMLMRNLEVFRKRWKLPDFYMSEMPLYSLYLDAMVRTPCKPEAEPQELDPLEPSVGRFRPPWWNRVYGEKKS